MPCIRNSGSDQSQLARSASDLPIHSPLRVPTSSTASDISAPSEPYSS